MSLEFSAQNLPLDLPSCDSIVQLCTKAGLFQKGVSFPDPSTGVPRFWVKYGYSDGIVLGEALTQQAVAQIVNAEVDGVVRVPFVYMVFLREERRYIVMEYIAGSTVASRQPGPAIYAPGDIEAIAAAYNRLLRLRVPADTPPGYVGSGGLIGNTFFDDYSRSSLRYNTIRELQSQINRLARDMGLSADFSEETADGLVLCLSDLIPTNFMIDDAGQLVVIDFGCTGYMPPSFVAWSLQLPHNGSLASRLYTLLEYPKTAKLDANLRAMDRASYYFIICGRNNIGVPKPRVLPGVTSSKRRLPGHRDAK